MKIAQIAPLIESVPPRLYGGTERVVSHLTEELVRLGHDVTLFASGDSITSADLVPCCPRALRLDPAVRDSIPHCMLMIDKVRGRAEEFDLFGLLVTDRQWPLERVEVEVIEGLFGYPNDMVADERCTLGRSLFRMLDAALPLQHRPAGIVILSHLAEDGAEVDLPVAQRAEPARPVNPVLVAAVHA